MSMSSQGQVCDHHGAAVFGDGSLFVKGGGDVDVPARYVYVSGIVRCSLS